MATALISDSAHNLPSTVDRIASTAITETISATPSNFSCASVPHCTVTVCTSRVSTSLDWKNKLKRRLLAVVCAVLSALQRLFVSKWGLARMGRTKSHHPSELESCAAVCQGLPSSYL